MHLVVIVVETFRPNTKAYTSTYKKDLNWTVTPLRISQGQRGISQGHRGMRAL